MILLLSFHTVRSDPYLAHTMSAEPEVRRVMYVYLPLCRYQFNMSTSTDRSVSGYPPSAHSALTVIPETFSRYDYPHHPRTAGYRGMHHESVGQWNGQEYVSYFLLSISSTS